MNKRKLFIANWKMHHNVHQASVLLHNYDKYVHVGRDSEVIIAPNMMVLQPLSREINHRKFKLASQNGYAVDEGPFMGEVSYAMQHNMVSYAVIGHSARKIYAQETDEQVRDKVAAAIRNNITPIICIGETKVERLAGETRHVLHRQILTALVSLTATDVAGIVIAYEPVWAISTFDGEVANPATIEPILGYIKDQIGDLYGKATSEDVRLVYGGSVDENDCRSYLALDNCEGVLVGAASLDASRFAKIVDN
jgi:triosephosphate isomerase (TIM)